MAQSSCGSTLATVRQVHREHGLGFNGLMRGCLPVMARDALFVGGFLGATPMLRRALAERLDVPHAAASLPAAVIVGVVTGAPSS